MDSRTTAENKHLATQSTTAGEKKQSKVWRDTGIALITRGLTWPFENVTYRASQWDSYTPYSQLYPQAFQRHALYDSYRVFLTAGFTQTIGKAFSTFGALRYISEKYPNFTPTQKAFAATCLGAPLEALTTSRGEARKVRQFLEIQTDKKLPELKLNEYGRIIAANFARVGYTSLTTYWAIYKAHDLFPTDNPIANAAVTAVASASVQVINMPVVNFHTQAMQNIAEPLSQTLTRFKQRTAAEIWKGTVGRCVHRGLFYTTAFGIANVADKFSRDPGSPHSGEKSALTFFGSKKTPLGTGLPLMQDPEEREDYKATIMASMK